MPAFIFGPLDLISSPQQSGNGLHPVPKAVPDLRK
jgi:hypothetical protein